MPNINEISNGVNKKILIIEDEEALASVLSSKFTRSGFEVMVGINGEDGLNKIEGWKPDLILLDIVMPKINGYEVLESLQKQGNIIPIIIISNSGQDVELEKTKKLGAVDYIVKAQINPEEVLEKVNKILNITTGDSVKNQVKDEETAGEGPNDGAKILLAEDDPFLGDICYKKLRKEGFNVVLAVDGAEAVKKVSEFKPQIVLLDIIMPSLDGFGVLKEIRSHQDKAIREVPVIMLTNLGQDEDIKKALDLGANDYLVKAHFTTEEIVEKVKSKLGL